MAFDLRRVLRLTCVGGLIHFALSTLFWLLAFLGALFTASRIGSSHITWSGFAPAWPGLTLLIGFAVTRHLIPTHPRSSALALLGLLLGAAASFHYDMAHDRYQMQSFSPTEGCSHFYLTWFWWSHDR